MSAIYYKTALDETSVYECPNSEDWDIDPYAAAGCADDYHSNHDGWEATWPLNLYLAETEAATTWTTFIIDREYTATFYARKQP